MLFAVEGGGFFSSSASGYSKGLSLLLLGQRSEDKPMRVAPWNQYQLVNRESHPELQLDSTKNQLSRGCASFVCFGRTSAGSDTPSPLKVGPAQQQDSPKPQVSNNGEDHSAHVDGDNDNRRVALKSSLKRPPVNKSVPFEADNELEPSGGKGIDATGGQTERKKVQWTDACGSELVEIREFEPSEVDESDDEFDNGNDRTCACAIISLFWGFPQGMQDFVNNQCCHDWEVNLWLCHILERSKLLNSTEASKLIANLIVMGGSILARAFVQAYRQALQNAAKNGVGQETMQNAVRRGSKIMTEKEAQQILGVTEETPWEEIVKKYDNLFEKNAKKVAVFTSSPKFIAPRNV
ncbi:hypothetical protein Lal_00000616 [Lupinus albus]|nr:hypothetical protein Lal_00000616 [Lupinus albus]